MGEYHKSYPVSTVRDLMFSVFTHVEHASNDVVSWVSDGNIAVWIHGAGTNGTADTWWDGIVTLTADHFGAGSFMVFEVDFANPGGRKWQGKVYESTSINIVVEGSPNGGFSTTTSDFGSEPTTGVLNALTSLTVGGGDEIYISVCDLDTYDAGAKKYGYLRAIWKDASSPTTPRGFYFGGYSPSNVVGDTDPFVVLYHFPTINNNLTAGWGYSGASAGSLGGRAPVEDGLATTSLVGANAFIAGSYPVNYLSYSQTRSGVEVEVQVTVHQQIGHLLGYFGPYTMRAVASAVGTFQVNNSGTRLAINDLAHRWVP